MHSFINSNVMPCSMKKAMIPLLLIFSLLVISSEGATQDFSASFSSISNRSLILQSYGGLQTLVAYEADHANSASARLLFIPSPNSNPSSYVLAAYVFAGTLDDEGAILWMANRDRPVSGNFSLTLNQSSGNLVLHDGDGTLAWSSDNSNRPVGPVSMDLETDVSGSLPIGTLSLSDANNTLWRSSDHPAHTLVSSQSLEPGMKLVSWASMANPSSGSYHLVMEASGLALYYKGSSLPYWAWSYYGHNNSFGVTHTCRNLIRAFMDPRGGLELQNTTDSALANSNNCSVDKAPSVQEVYFDDYNTSTSSGTVRFLQIHSNGSLIAHTLAQGWSTVFDLFNKNKCLIPNYCGPYGVCTAPSNCACPSSSDGSFPSAAASRAQGCPPTRALSCSPGSKLKLLPLSGVDYFANKYSSPLTNFSTEELCKDACLDNCSCLAAFWHAHSNACFHASDMSGLQDTLNGSYMAFVKVEMPPKSNQRLVVGCILGGVALVVIMILAGAFIYRKRRVAEDEDPFWKSVPGLSKYSYKDLESITNGFSEEMGKGGFGVVYAGVLKDGTKVAVKRLESLRQGTKEFRAEVVILGGLHHNNVVGLIGFCAEGPHRVLVYEYMGNGSLDHWLFAKEKLPLEWKHRFNIALGAARGLAYLHGECKDTILHLDIKPENILLDGNFVAKVSDFGLSTLMGRNETHVITTMRGTPGYLAPEWLAEGFEVSAKCDVFSFGKVLMELFSGRRNLDPSLQETDKLYFPSWLYHITQQGKEVDLSHVAKVESPEEMRQARLVMNTAFLCVLENPTQRPSMERVVHMLEGRVPELEDLELSDLFQGLQFALRMPMPGLADGRIEEALVPLYRTLSLDPFGSSSRSAGMSSVMSSGYYISAR